MRKSEYHLHLKSLKKELIPFGTKLYIRKLPVKYPNKFGVEGMHYKEKNSITITIYGNQSYKSILAVLAHEVRHSQHCAYGLFPDYYKQRSDDIYQKVKSKDLSVIIEKPCIKTAQEAEDDCNDFAISWMFKNDIPLDYKKSSYRSFFNPYPIYLLSIYWLWSNINLLEKSTRIDPS